MFGGRLDLGGGGLYSEVQCIMGMDSPVNRVMTENLVCGLCNGFRHHLYWH